MIKQTHRVSDRVSTVQDLQSLLHVRGFFKRTQLLMPRVSPGKPSFEASNAEGTTIRYLAWKDGMTRQALVSAGFISLLTLASQSSFNLQRNMAELSDFVAKLAQLMSR